MSLDINLSFIELLYESDITLTFVVVLTITQSSHTLYCSIQVYLYRAFHNTYCFKAALQKVFFFLQ